MKKTLTVKELYKLEPEKIVSGPDALTETELICHLLNETKEIDFPSWDYIGHHYDIDSINNDFPIEVRYLKDFCFDGRRTWVMAIAYWMNTPFAIYKNYGRDNDEYTECHITNHYVMDTFIEHLNTYKINDEGDKPKDLSEDEEISIQFYNCNLLVKETFKYW